VKLPLPWTRIVSIALVASGGILFGVALFSRSALNLALPLFILVLGAGFLWLAFWMTDCWAGAPWFYLPGCTLMTLGLILFINVATGDWNAWAYAWMLLVAGLGLGVALLGRQGGFSRLVWWIGLGIAGAGLTFFALFGMIAGGLFIQIVAPLLLAAAGGLLWKLRPDLPLRPRVTAAGNDSRVEAAIQAGLPEALSMREIEVLRLIAEGLTNAAIAERLVVAPSTVKTHINNIYGKLGVQTRVQALQRARALGLLPR
jgi:DNA-binding CsgD family transcriptional regulator